MSNNYKQSFSNLKKALIIVHQKRSDPGEVGIKLKSRGYELDVRRPALGEKLPESMDDHNLAVIFGGPMSINDMNKDFIRKEINWIELALKSSKPFLGICLGAQMLAKSLGGTVGKNSDNSYEIGFFDIVPTKIGNKMFEKQKTFFQWHNEGFNVPKECLVLAEGKKFRQQAFKFNNAFGLQFHPEVNLKLHLLWIYYTLLLNPHKFKDKGTQSIYKQLAKRIKHDYKIKNWLDDFLDNYLLNQVG